MPIRIIHTILYYIFEFISTFVISLLIMAAAAIGRDKTAISLFKMWGRLIFKATGSTVELSGLENLDKKECYIFCPNHSSAFDIYLLSGYLPFDFCWVSKDAYLKVPVLGGAMRALNFIGMDRNNPKKAFASLKKSIDLILSKKLSFIIFPEGTRSLDGNLLPFKRGSLFIAVNTGVKIVPTTIIGAFAILPKKKILINRSKVKIIFSEPLPAPSQNKEEQIKTLELLSSVISKQLTGTEIKNTKITDEKI